MSLGNNVDRALAEKGKDQAGKRQEHEKKKGGSKPHNEDHAHSEDSGGTPGNKTHGEKGGERFRLIRLAESGP